MTYAGGFHRDKNGFWIDAAGKWPDNPTVTLLQAVEKAVKEEEAFREKNDRYVSDILNEQPKKTCREEVEATANFFDWTEIKALLKSMADRIDKLGGTGDDG